MKKLRESMENIGSCSDQINTTLSGRREKIDHLATVHKLLTRLQFIVELPARLRKCQSMQAYAQAATYFNQASGLLVKYKHLPSFVRIHSECEEIMSDMKKQLYAQLLVTAPPAPAGDVTSISPMVLNFKQLEDAATVLLQLKEPEEELRKQFLACHSVAFDYLLMQFAPDRNTNIPVHEIAKRLGPPFFTQLLRTFESYRSIFMARDLEDDDINLENFHFEGPAWDQVFKFSKTVFEKYLRAAHQKLAENKSSAQSVASEEVISCLAVVHDVSLQVNRQLPFLHIAERTSDMISSTVLASVEAQFAGLHTVAVDGLTQLNTAVDDHTPPDTLAGQGTDDHFYAAAVARFAQELSDAFAQAVQKLQPFFNPNTKFLQQFHMQFAANIFIKLQQFFLFLDQLFTNYQSGTGDKSGANSARISPAFALALVGVCQRIEGFLPDVITLVRESFSAAGTEELVKVDELKAVFTATSSRLLQMYVQMEGRLLSSFMRKALETNNWLRAKEPKRVGAGALFFLQRCQEAHVLVEQLLLEHVGGSRGGAGGARSGGGSGGYGTAGALFFERKVDLFARVDFSRTAVIAAITRIGLKSLCECVRLCTFGRFGFQQLQVDLAYIKQGLTNILGLQRDLVFFFEEAEMNARCRCSDCAPISAGVLQLILTNKPAAM
eukprot:TRINITY_DN860_c0_g1_i1.p1 TRINITY_DN860_c0_g1~~TRINITY_DN860_c0_g1_i1.p1  ORF type:complete len:772 (-),score=245.51 TRINITY_DN860_c0_g1_i1:94-2091(-)